MTNAERSFFHIWKHLFYHKWKHLSHDERIACVEAMRRSWEEGMLPFTSAQTVPSDEMLPFESTAIVIHALALVGDVELA